MKVKVVSRYYLTPTDMSHWVFKYTFASRRNARVISQAGAYMSRRTTNTNTEIFAFIAVPVFKFLILRFCLSPGKTIET